MYEDHLDANLTSSDQSRGDEVLRNRVLSSAIAIHDHKGGLLGVKKEGIVLIPLTVPPYR